MNIEPGRSYWQEMRCEVNSLPCDRDQLLVNGEGHERKNVRRTSAYISFEIRGPKLIRNSEHTNLPFMFGDWGKMESQWYSIYRRPIPLFLFIFLFVWATKWFYLRPVPLNNFVDVLCDGGCIYWDGDQFHHFNVHRRFSWGLRAPNAPDIIKHETKSVIHTGGGLPWLPSAQRGLNETKLKSSWRNRTKQNKTEQKKNRRRWVWVNSPRSTCVRCA